MEVKLSVVTQFLSSLDVFALNLTGSTSFDLGNICERFNVLCILLQSL